MPTLAIVNVALFAGLLGVLYQFGQRENWTLSRRVLLGLIGGTVFGFIPVSYTHLTLPTNREV